MNEVKRKEAELLELVARLHASQDEITQEYGTPDAEARRWLAIGKTHLQEGCMALTRAVAKPQALVG